VIENRTLRIELRQAAPKALNLMENIKTVYEALESSTAELLVFPELFLSGYDIQHLEALALSIEEEPIKLLADACRNSRVALLVGFAERGDEGFHDSYLAIDRDGAVRQPIRKTHLFGAERDVFREGNSLKPVVLCGISVGVMNCFEIEFPEVARTLALRGAEILVVGSANMHPFAHSHLLATESRALENRLPLAYVNRIGEQGGHRFCGLSRVIRPDGTVARELNETEMASICEEVAIGSPVPDESDMLAQRRPELYSA
jgi:predicted amidohydrolase